MKKITLIYEVRNRELDNAILLKKELERRGYGVRIKEKENTVYFFHRDALLIVPNFYKSVNDDYYRYRYNAFDIPVINLQYEQICSDNQRDIDFFSVSGKARSAVHLCWGQVAYDRLKANLINENNLYIPGAVHLDFLRKEFTPFWYTRQQLSMRYKIPNNKKWLLYISGFAFADNPYIEDTVIQQLGGHYKNVGEFHKQNREITLDWFERLLNQERDLVILYRPHPMEWNIKRTNDILSNYKERFFVIPDLNIKQWIIVSDIIITWYSTSIAECFSAKKGLFLLRPEPIPSDFDAEIYRNCNYISTFDELSRKVSDLIIKREECKEIPIDVDIIESYYRIDDECPSYIQVADIVTKYMENNTKSDGIQKRINWQCKRWIYLIKEGVVIKMFLKKIYKLLYRYLHIKLNNDEIRKRYALNIWEEDVLNRKKNALELKNKERIMKQIVQNYEELKSKK